MAASSSAGPSTIAGQPPTNSNTIRVANYNVGAKDDRDFTSKVSRRAKFLNSITTNLQYLDDLGVSIVVVEDIHDPEQPHLPPHTPRPTTHPTHTSDHSPAPGVGLRLGASKCETVLDLGVGGFNV